MSSVRKFTYEELCLATNNFKSCHEVGDSGKVYRAVIDGQVVAIKKFEKVDFYARKTDDFFDGELDVLAFVDHPYIMKLIGYCSEVENCLVYSFVQGGTLAAMFSSRRRAREFTLIRQVEVLLHIAEAIHYLHNHKRRVVHRDICVSNVLIEYRDLSPVVSGFRLPRYLHQQTEGPIERDVPNFPRVVDPFRSTHRASLTNDIYGFGVVILGIIAGKVNVDGRSLCDWANAFDDDDHHKFADDRLDGHYPVEQLVELLRLGQNCVHGVRIARPTIDSVCSTLAQIHAKVLQWDHKQTGASTSVQDESDEGGVDRAEGVERNKDGGDGVHTRSEIDPGGQEQRCGTEVVGATRLKRKGKVRNYVCNFLCAWLRMF